MSRGWARRLRERIDELGLTDAEVCRRAGVGATMVADIERGSTPSVDKVARLARAVGWSLSKLYEGTEAQDVALNIVGISGVGEMWADIAPVDARQIALKLLEEDLVTIEIASDDIPGYEIGDVISGPKMLGAHLDNLVGTECIVESMDGRKEIKILMRGEVPGLYTLRSHDPKNDDVRNIKLRWAAPIQLVLKKPR